MIARRFALFLLILGLLGTAWPARLAQAARGTPGSAEFGFGAYLDLSGSFAIDSVHLASDLELDWLALDFSWQAAAPKPGAIDWSRIDPILQAAGRSQQSVMLSLTQAPEWALTPQGPDSAKCAALVIQILQRYPNTVQAIELFPGANTTQGWGRQPNPKAYFSTWNAVQAAIKSAKLSTLLVAGGLLPIPSGSPAAQGVNDLTFLQELYSAKVQLPVISIQAGSLTGDPLQAPDKVENRVLRHYEEVRAVMLNNKQDAGKIWITHITPPTGSIAANDRRYQDLSNQALWLSQAYDQMKSQLYIGVAFLGQINPQANPADAAFSLLQPSGDYHPFFRMLRDRIAINRSNAAYLRPGRAKAEPLQKNTKGTK